MDERLPGLVQRVFDGSGLEPEVRPRLGAVGARAVMHAAAAPLQILLHLHRRAADVDVREQVLQVRLKLPDVQFAAAPGGRQLIARTRLHGAGFGDQHVRLGDVAHVDDVPQRLPAARTRQPFQHSRHGVLPGTHAFLRLGQQRAEHHARAHRNGVEAAVLLGGAVHLLLGGHLGHRVGHAAVLVDVLLVPVGVALAAVAGPVVLREHVAALRRVADGGEGTGVDEALDGAGLPRRVQQAAGAGDRAVVDLPRLVAPGVAKRRTDVQHGAAVRQRLVVAAGGEQIGGEDAQLAGAAGAVQGQQVRGLVGVAIVGETGVNGVAALQQRCHRVRTDVAGSAGDGDGAVVGRYGGHGVSLMRMEVLQRSLLERRGPSQCILVVRSASCPSWLAGQAGKMHWCS